MPRSSDFQRDLLDTAVDQFDLDNEKVSTSPEAGSNESIPISYLEYNPEIPLLDIAPGLAVQQTCVGYF
jgi:hypothetical protein